MDGIFCEKASVLIATYIQVISACIAHCGSTCCI